MAQVFEEIVGGDIQFEPARTVRRYRFSGSPEGVVPDWFSYVASLALAQTPATWILPAPIGLLYRADIQIHENAYARHYEITVPYTRVRREAGAYQITVDQTGGSVHVTGGTRKGGYGVTKGGLGDEEFTVEDTPFGPLPVPDPKYKNNRGLIGVDGDEVIGVDIPIEQTRITVSFRHPQGNLSREYIRRIGRLVGYPNKDEFLGYEPGEVRYLGGVFTETETEATAQYNFEIAYNTKEEDDLRLGLGQADPLGDSIHIKEKDGFDILSPVYERATDDSQKNSQGEDVLKTIRKAVYWEVITPAGREQREYASEKGFGWGGTPSTEEE